MSFRAPWLLVFLLLVPAAVFGYVLLERWRTTRAQRWSSGALLPNMVPRGPGWRRYVPLAFFLLALSLLLVGFARPEATINVPREGATVVIALDISGSMQAKDVRPGPVTRLAAARQTAIQFLDDLPDKYRVSLVTFGNRGTVRVPPTNDQDRVAARLPVKAESVGTALASGIERATKVAEVATKPKPGEKGSAAAVLLISDGSNTAEADPRAAAEKARRQRVKIWTVLLGTSGADAVVRQKIPGGPPGSEEVIQVPVAPQTLQDVAQRTGGQFFQAVNSKQLQAVYKDLQSQMVKDKKKREITVGVAGAALGCLLVGALLSGLWFRRLV